MSWRLDIDTVPTLLRVEGGKEQERTEGWERGRWEAFTGVDGPRRRACPSTGPAAARAPSTPTSADELAGALRRRPAAVAGGSSWPTLEDEMEAMFDRGWTDGLPVVPPTPRPGCCGCSRARPGPPDEVVAVVPPDLVECTVEKVAVNAVMAGCRPEYLPVVLAAVEAACTDEFNMHGAAGHDLVRRARS